MLALFGNSRPRPQQSRGRSQFARNYAGVTFAEEPVIDEEGNELPKAREEFTRLS